MHVCSTKIWNSINYHIWFVVFVLLVLLLANNQGGQIAQWAKILKKVHFGRTMVALLYFRFLDLVFLRGTGCPGALDPHSRDSLGNQHHAEKLSPKIVLHLKCSAKVKQRYQCTVKPQRLKSKIPVEGSLREPGVNEKIQKTLILVFEVIVQPSKHTLGYCTITWKTIINVFFLIFLFTPGAFREPSTWNFFKKTLIFAFVQTVHCVLPKWTFFCVLGHCGFPAVFLNDYVIT